MNHPNTDRDERVDPELDALSWNPTAEEADAYLRGHGVIKKCEHCGQDATLTNDFVSHLLARFGERMREADDAATRMHDLCLEKVRESGAYWREVSRQFQRGDEEFAFFKAKASAADDLERALQSLTLEQGEQEKR